MPRRPRIAFAHMPHHIVQRGHRRGTVFFSRSDRVDYLGTLAEFRVALDVRVYAYCLMDNHVHLIVDPGEDASKLSELMRHLAGRHARRLNSTHDWRGTLWESRFKCSPIDTERYLLACGRYIDQNPVRAGIAASPAEYEWSSYRARAGLSPSNFLDSDPALEALALQRSRRNEIYRELAAAPLPDKDLELIRGALQRNQLTGNEDFIRAIQKGEGIEVAARRPGRPRKRRLAAPLPSQDLFDRK
jgi:putative transposase